MASPSSPAWWIEFQKGGLKRVSKRIEFDLKRYDPGHCFHWTDWVTIISNTILTEFWNLWDVYEDVECVCKILGASNSLCETLSMTFQQHKRTNINPGIMLVDYIISSIEGNCFLVHFPQLVFVREKRNKYQVIIDFGGK